MNLPRIVHQPRSQGGWRASLVRTAFGQPAKSKNEAVLQDTFDLIPLLGDIPNFIKIFTSKGNRGDQTIDFLVGLVPIIGDIADFLLLPDTNLEEFEKRKKEKGRVETLITFSFIPNAAEKYFGGVDRNIWEDEYYMSNHKSESGGWF